MQYAFGAHSAIRAQYEFIDLGSVSFDSPGSPPLFVDFSTHSRAELREHAVHVARAGQDLGRGAGDIGRGVSAVRSRNYGHCALFNDRLALGCSAIDRLDGDDASQCAGGIVLRSRETHV